MFAEKVAMTKSTCRGTSVEFYNYEMTECICAISVSVQGVVVSIYSIISEINAEALSALSPADLRRLL